jgi:hypothetical protein
VILSLGTTHGFVHLLPSVSSLAFVGARDLGVRAVKVVFVSMGGVVMVCILV